jgi:hypothetical protein
MPRQTKISVDMASRLYLSGKSIHEVAQLMGATYAAIHYHLKRSGTPRRPQGKALRQWNKRDWPIRSIVQMYESGQSTYAIAKSLNCANATIGRLLTQAGVVMRAQRDYPSKIIGAQNPNWRGGRRTNSDGYVQIRVLDQSGRFSYQREHRAVMEGIIGRPLKAHEHVHHINGIRDDNRPENLAITSPRMHESRTLLKAMQRRILFLEHTLEHVHSVKVRGSDSGMATTA